MFSRYAVYAVPDGAWGDFGAAWLGWDTRFGAPVDITDPLQEALTARPRKYGFHGTIKPPFRLAEGATVEDLSAGLRDLCASFAPVPMASLRLSQIGRFFAMVAPDENTAIGAVAAECVQTLDAFRAPLNEKELARRRASKLTDRQEELLTAYGYPYVLDEFRFHLTLTGPVDAPEAVATRLREATEVPLQTPLSLDSLCVSGEDEAGRFRVIDRIPFGG